MNEADTFSDAQLVERYLQLKVRAAGCDNITSAHDNDTSGVAFVAFSIPNVRDEAEALRQAQIIFDPAIFGAENVLSKTMIEVKLITPIHLDRLYPYKHPDERLFVMELWGGDDAEYRRNIEKNDSEGFARAAKIFQQPISAERSEPSINAGYGR